MALIVGTWSWGTKYPRYYVERLAASVARNIVQDFRFMVFRPLEEDEHLTEVPGCFCRLRMFDPTWQKLHGIKPGDRLVCMDLDTVITWGIDPLFDRPEDFVILQGVNSSGFRYNGSLWMLRAGYRPDVWADFSLDAAARVPYHDFPDDQSWMEDRIPNAGAWGPRDGVYAYLKPGWPMCRRLPLHARLVAFPGRRDPSQIEHVDWVRKNWRV